MAQDGGMCLANSRLQCGGNCKEDPPLCCFCVFNIYKCFYNRAKTACVGVCIMDHMVKETKFLMYVYMSISLYFCSMNTNHTICMLVCVFDTIKLTD